MINKLIYEGRLTADPELRQTQSGVANLFFTVAWSEKYKEVEKKCFLQCKAWRGTAEFIAKYFTKGQGISLVGKLSTEEWTAEDGSKRSRIVLDVEEAHFYGSKRDNEGTTAAAPTGTTAPVGAPPSPQWETVSDEGLPF